MTNLLKAVQIVENVITAENVNDHIIIVIDAMKKQRKMIAAINVPRKNRNHAKNSLIPVKNAQIPAMYLKNVGKIK